MNSLNISWKNNETYHYLNNIKGLLSIYTIMQKTQFVPFRISDEKTAFPPFGRVETACYPASHSGKAYVYCLAQVSSASRPSQLVNHSF